MKITKSCANLKFLQNEFRIPLSLKFKKKPTKQNKNKRKKQKTKKKKKKKSVLTGGCSKLFY